MQKGGVCHGAPTGKKCANLAQEDQILSELQEGTVTYGLQASPSVKLKKPVEPNLLTRAEESRVEAVEDSVTEMKLMDGESTTCRGGKGKEG